MTVLAGLLSGDPPNMFERLFWSLAAIVAVWLLAFWVIPKVPRGIYELRNSIEDLLTPVHPDDQPTLEQDQETHIKGNRKYTPFRARLIIYSSLGITFFCGMTFHWAACNPGA